MNYSDSDEPRHEIIIVRRGGGDEEEGHHGGVWKIAFADFMTAMMCFFLVMWLINAANEQTKAAVASYFNPVKLVDRNTNRKGLEDIGEGPEQASTKENTEKKETDKKAGANNDLSGPAENEAGTDISEQPKHSDENFFANPYAVLADIAAETGYASERKHEGGWRSRGSRTGHRRLRGRVVSRPICSGFLVVAQRRQHRNPAEPWLRFRYLARNNNRTATRSLSQRRNAGRRAHGHEAGRGHRPCRLQGRRPRHRRPRPPPAATTPRLRPQTAPRTPR